MKALIILVLILSLSAPVLAASGDTWVIRPTYPDLSRPIGEAGSFTNPYKATERYDGSIEIKPTYPDLRQPLGTPGSFTNPYIIQPGKY
jgi:hypothetical protein